MRDFVTLWSYEYLKASGYGLYAVIIYAYVRTAHWPFTVIAAWPLERSLLHLRAPERTWHCSL